MDPKILEIIYNDEIKRTTTLLNYKFRKADAAKNGRVSLAAFKRIIRETRFLTPKEKNLLIRLQTEDTIVYSQFPEMIYQVRFDIAMSELMETEISELEKELVHVFRQREHADSPGQISISQTEDALRNCKLLNLTPF